MKWMPVIIRWHFDDGDWHGSVLSRSENNVNFWTWFVKHKTLSILAEGKEEKPEEALKAATNAYEKLAAAFGERRE
jgi:hypothetical protein